MIDELAIVRSDSADPLEGLMGCRQIENRYAVPLRKKFIVGLTARPQEPKWRVLHWACRIEAGHISDPLTTEVVPDEISYLAWQVK